MLVCKIYKPEVIYAGPTETITTAAIRMREKDVSSLAVMEDEKLLGIFSERDVV